MGFGEIFLDQTWVERTIVDGTMAPDLAYRMVKT